MFELKLGDSITGFRFARTDVANEASSGHKRLAVCDENTRRFVPDAIAQVISLQSGERHKVWDSVEAILVDAVRLGLARDDFVVAVGGGVVCDVAAFAASIYMRGCRIVMCPTTLLSMIDASFGGKTGMDFLDVKNLVGTYYPADEIIIDLSTLVPLSEREYLSGLAEAIKHAMLGDEALFALLEQSMVEVKERSEAAVQQIVEASIRVKGRIVEADLRESGVRRHLNLGHTFGHAIESASGFELTHGEAVAWGIGKALRLGRALGMTDEAYARRSFGLLERYGFRLRGLRFDRQLLLEKMRSDKKRKSGTLKFIIQKTIGETLVTEVENDLLNDVLDDDSPIE